MSTPRLILPVFLVLVMLLGACDYWPLYRYLPDPNRPVPTATELVVEEAAEGSVGEVQTLDLVPGPVEVVINGRVESCGFDETTPGPDWPSHPVDSNGDGIADASRSRSGWYTGDLDLFLVTPPAESRVHAILDWSARPTGESNSPYLPGDAAAAWSGESDLDVWFVRSSALPGGSIASEEGVSRRVPERAEGGLVVAAGAPLVVGVSCHHELPSDYELRVKVRPTKPWAEASASN